MRQLLVIHDKKSLNFFIQLLLDTFLCLLLGSMLGSNYWDSCPDHAVFGRIACVTVEKYIFDITLRSQIYWPAVISSSGFESIPNVMK